MANWYGHARSNYVKIKDIFGLLDAIEPFALGIYQGDNGDVGFITNDEYGGWPSSTELENGEELWFDPGVHIVPFLVDGEVLIMMQVGSEKLRYLTGSASAYHSDGRVIDVTIDQIYEKVRTEFNKTPSLCEY